ncbi:hypothetical protein IC575_009446 [Cucumis melo]
MIWALTKNDVCFITKCSPDDPHRHPRRHHPINVLLFFYLTYHSILFNNCLLPDSGQLPTTVPFRLTAAMLLLPNSPAKQHRPISESLLSSLSVINESNRNRKF